MGECNTTDNDGFSDFTLAWFAEGDAQSAREGAVAVTSAERRWQPALWLASAVAGVVALAALIV